MTLQEAVSEYQYDVSIYYSEDEFGSGWAWDINGGYCSVGGSFKYRNINDALNELITFLKTFEPFEK